MTKPDNDYVKALKLARARLWEKRKGYICENLREVADADGSLEPAVEKLCDWIARSIGRSGTSLWIWLGECGHFGKRKVEPQGPLMLAYRIRYINHMIQLWKEVK